MLELIIAKSQLTESITFVSAPAFRKSSTNFARPPLEASMSAVLPPLHDWTENTE